MAKSISPPGQNIRPVHSIRHRNIKATIWLNETQKGPMYDVVVTRSYRDAERWHDSHSFGYDDLLVVAKLMSDAHSFITTARAKQFARPKVSSKKQAGTTP